ncbi:MAG: hypothetical protein QOK27_2158, partial [Gemmatimonadales bacterium]|nr:hypothetical protein [Gemmatimonadales bacterium]
NRPLAELPQRLQSVGETAAPWQEDPAAASSSK